MKVGIVWWSSKNYNTTSVLIPLRWHLTYWTIAIWVISMKSRPDGCHRTHQGSWGPVFDHCDESRQMMTSNRTATGELISFEHVSYLYIYIHTDQVSPQLSFCLFNRNLPRKWYRRVISSRSTMINEHPLRLVIWASLSQSVGLTNMGMESNAFIGDINERPVPKVSKGIQYGGRRVPTTSSNSMARSMAHIIDQDIPESCSRWCPPRWVSSIYPPVLILF